MSDRRDRIRFGPFVFDLGSQELRQSGRVVDLPPRAAAILECLLREPGRLVTKDALIEQVWEGLHVMDHSLTEAVGVLRKTLDDDARSPVYIQTVPRRGYRFVANVESVATTRAALPVTASATAPSDSPDDKRIELGLAVPLVLIAAIAVSVLGSGPANQRAHFEGIPVAVTLEPELPLNIASSFAVRLSPDGSWLLYRSGNAGWTGGQIHRRPIGRHQAEPLQGTEGGLYPAISPSGDRFVFFRPDGEEGVAEWRYRLMLSRADGGNPTALATTGAPFGADWLDANRLVFADLRASGPPGPERRQEQGLWVMELGADAPVRLTTPAREAGEGSHVWPEALPDGSSVLFTVVPSGTTRSEDSSIDLVDVATGERTRLIDHGAHPLYSPSGHIVFVRGGQLVAVPFDADRRELAGPARAVLTDVLEYDVFTTPGYDISERGHLVYLRGPRPAWPGRLTIGTLPTGTLEWVDLPESIAAGSPRFSPDGSRLVFGRWPEDTFHATLEILELASGVRTPTSLPGNVSGFAWAPDGDRLAYGWTDAEQNWGIRARRPDGAGVDDLLPVAPRPAVEPNEWLDDGRILMTAWGGRTRYDLHLLTPDGTTRPLLATPAPERCPRLSPDGRWLAYSTRVESGDWHVEVRSFPDLERRIRVSRTPGSSAVWAPDGSGLYYLEAGDTDHNRLLFSPLVAEGSELRAAEARTVMDLPGRVQSVHLCRLDIDPTGERIAVTIWQPNRSPLVTELNLLVNWALAGS